MGGALRRPSPAPMRLFLLTASTLFAVAALTASAGCQDAPDGPTLQGEDPVQSDGDLAPDATVAPGGQDLAPVPELTPEPDLEPEATLQPDTTAAP